MRFLVVALTCRLECISMFFYQSVYLADNLPIYLSSYLFDYLPVHLSDYLPMYRSVCLSIYPSIYMSIYPSIYPSIYLSVYLSICTCMYLCMQICVYLSVRLSMHRYAYICMRICMNTYLHTHASFLGYTASHVMSIHNMDLRFIHMCTYMCIPHIDVFMYMYICTYVRTYARTYVCRLVKRTQSWLCRNPDGSTLLEKSTLPDQRKHNKCMQQSQLGFFRRGLQGPTQTPTDDLQ